MCPTIYWARKLSDKKRVKNGAKGIGRFALDRLGMKTEMWTLSKESNSEGLYWEMDWTQFDNFEKAISEIEADLSKLPLNMKSKVLEIIGNDFLNDEIKSFEFNHGTILKISNLKDEWFPNEVKGVFTTLESLIPPKELNIPFKVYFKSKQDYNLYGNVNTAFFNDFDYKIDATFDATEQTVKFSIERNELDLKILKKKYKEIFENFSYPFDIETIQKQRFEYTKSISKILNKEFNNETLLEVGSFHFSFNYIKFAKSLKEGYPFKDIVPSERRATLKRFGGIKIYRDSFRVRPYGDPQNDWLGLGFRAAKSPAGAGQRIGDWRVNNESLAGIITISRKENPNLIDKSDRGSLQENDAFELFKNIIIGIIHEFEIDRSRILNPIYLFNKKEKEKEKEIEIQKRAEELALIIIEENNSKIPLTAEKQKETYEEFFKDSFRKIIDENKEEENQEIVQIRSLASLGLIVSSFSHELKEVSNNISEIDSLEKNMMKLLPKEKYNTTEYEDIVEIFALLTDDKEKIKHWVDYTLTAIRKDKRKRTKLDFDLFFNQLKLVWSRIFKRKDIKLELINNIGGINYDFRAFEMDMTTIFSNLINNSIDSFEERNIIDERIIQISYGITEKGFEINYFDNGKGLDKTFTNKEDIFLAFTTSKVDRHGNEIGTGLGMYLVKSVIDDNNGSIQILEPENGFGIRLLFPLNLK